MMHQALDDSDQTRKYGISESIIRKYGGERVYRDCIKMTRDKTRIYSIPHDTCTRRLMIVTKRESMASLNP